MPGFDGTGPRGEGPMTGGGRGFCARPAGYVPYGGAGRWYPPYGTGWAAPYPYGYTGYGIGYRPVYGVGRGGIPYGGGRGRTYGGGRGRGRW